MMKYKSYTPEILNLLLSRSRNSSRSNSTVSSKHSIRDSMNTSKIVTEDSTYLPTVVGIGRGSRKGFLVSILLSLKRSVSHTHFHFLFMPPEASTDEERNFRNHDKLIH